MGCLTLGLNFLLPGLGTLLFTNKRVQGFIQLFIIMINSILLLATAGLWIFIGIFVHLGVFIWALTTTMGHMSDQAARKAVQQERGR
jgi:hypothetical protein